MFSTQVTRGWPVTSAMAAATSSATAYPSREESSGFLWNSGRARQPVGPGQRLVPAPLGVLAAGAQLAAEQRGPADLGEGGQHGERGGPAVLPGQQRLGPAVPGPRRARSRSPRCPPRRSSRPGRAAAPGRSRASGRTTVGQQVLQVPHARVGAGHRPGSSRVCAASAAANAVSWAARRARTAARTAASPAPRSGSLTPGAASLTAESTHASLSPCRSSSACRDAAPAAELPASQRASRTAAWKAGRPLVGVREPVGGHPGPGPLDAQPGRPGNPRQVGIRRRSARQGGAQRARQRREPAGQPGGQQVRAVGQPAGADGGEQFVGAGEQPLAVGAGRPDPGASRR